MLILKRIDRTDLLTQKYFSNKTTRDEERELIDHYMKFVNELWITLKEVNNDKTT